jgi:hypothetical protein
MDYREKQFPVKCQKLVAFCPGLEFTVSAWGSVHSTHKPILAFWSNQMVRIEELDEEDRPL